MSVTTSSSHSQHFGKTNPLHYPQHASQPRLTRERGDEGTKRRDDDPCSTYMIEFHGVSTDQTDTRGVVQTQSWVIAA